MVGFDKPPPAGEHARVVENERQARQHAQARVEEGAGRAGQPVGAAPRKPLKLTLLLTESPTPGPAPDGPLGLPHQLSVAVMGAVPPA